MRFVPSHKVAKSFGRYQEEALVDEPVAVTRYGRPTVVILAYDDYERLRRGADLPRHREVYRAGALPPDLVDQIRSATPPAEAARHDDELEA
jgi:prevent-host-death family protein